MANLLADLAYLSTDMLKKGIINTIINESPFAARMPFITVQGNSYKYNMETALAGVSWYEVNETWVEAVPTWDTRSVVLEILGGDADVDKYVVQTRSNEQDIARAVIEKKAKAVANEFELKAVVGRTSTTSSTKEMKGLMLLLAECETATSTLSTDWDVTNNGQIIDIGALASTSGALTFAKIDELIDAVKPGKPDAFMTGRRTRRKINVLANASGSSPLRVEQEGLGKFIEFYDGIPILISDHVPENIQDPTSGITTIANYVRTNSYVDTTNCSVLFALKWGEDQGICGVHNGGIQTELIGTLETKDATRTRIKWYVGMANFSQKSLAGLVNYSPAD